MSEQTIEAPVTRPEPGRTDTPRRRRSAGELARAYPWAIVAAALVLFSLGLVLWAGTRPGYDPYGWLGWGYQTLHLSLDLGGAPSWKPLTFLFTVPYAVFGKLELWLWMLTAVTLSLAGPIFAGRIAYRLVATEPERRMAGIVAGVFAGFSVLGINMFFHNMLSAQSDTMITALWLGAVDLHLSGHPRWAFALAVLASLGRPEGWPVLGAYSLWLWRGRPEMRLMIAGGFALMAFLWFGIPTITNLRPLIASELAEKSVRALHENKALGTFHRFTDLTYLPIQLAALGAAIASWFLRARAVSALALATFTWLIVEIAFSLHGYSGVPRYMFPAAGLLCALAGVGVGWIIVLAPRIRRGLPRWIGAPVVLAIVATLVPAALARLRAERRDLTHERGRTTVVDRLRGAIDHMGGSDHVNHCGRPVTNVEYTSILAWYTGRPVGKVGYKALREIHSGDPIILFTELYNGWQARTVHTDPAKAVSCANLNAAWIFTGRHPNGVLVPNK